MNARQIKSIVWVTHDISALERHLEDSQCDNVSLTSTMVSLETNLNRMSDAGLPRRAQNVRKAIEPARAAIATRNIDREGVESYRKFETIVSNACDAADDAACAEPKSEVVSQFDLDHVVLGPDNYVVVGIEQALSYLSVFAGHHNDDDVRQAIGTLEATLEQIESERETSQI